MSDKIAQAEALKVEGNGFYAKKMYEQAIEKYAAAIALDPQNHIYYSNRSICYAESGQFEAAEKDGDMCVKLNAGFAKGYHRRQRGTCWRSTTRPWPRSRRGSRRTGASWS